MCKTSLLSVAPACRGYGGGGSRYGGGGGGYGGYGGGYGRY
jgi:CspA family cold shock protein